MSWWSNNISDKAVTSLCKTLRRRKLTCGKEVAKFEQKFCEKHKMKYGVMTTSGTMALMMSGLALGIRKQSKVIVSGSTWVASAQAAALLGAKVDFLDIDEATGSVKITKDTIHKISDYDFAILVHYNGREVKGLELLKKTKTKIIEDCCKSMFVPKNSKTWIGSEGDISCFSFGMFSVLPIGYGGFAATNDLRYYNQLKCIRDHGVIRGENEEYKQIGLNGKPTDFIASLALENLRQVDERILKVKKINEIYFNTLNSNYFSELGRSKVPLLNDTICRDPQRTKKILESKKIPFGLFHPPLNMAKYFDTIKSNKLKNANRVYKNGIHLPCGPSQSLNKIYRIAKAINKNIS